MSDSKDPAAPLSVLLASWQRGDGAAFAALFDQAYAELKRIAAQRIAHLSARSTLTPTELLHESVLRVMDGAVTWQNRAHFFASMSVCMRTVLLDHARARHSNKRGGDLLRVSPSDAQRGEEFGIAELLSLDSAPRRLEQLDARSSAVLHLTYFGGLARAEIAEVLKVSVQIVGRELRFAKSWPNIYLESAL